MKPAVVFGGSGFIGTHLVEHLIASGHKVVIADIRPPALELHSVTYTYCDVRQPIQVDIEAGATVYNLAAVHRTPGHADSEYFETNVGGAFNITEWCEDIGVDTVCFTSSISVYGPTEDPLDEAAELRPNSAYGKSKQLAEQIHFAWQQRRPGRRLVVARPAVVFGPGEQGNFSRLAHAMARRRFVFPGRDDTIKSCGYVKDLVQSFDFALSGSSDTFLFNFAYPDRYTTRDICETFVAVAGYPTPRMFPPTLVTAGLAVLDRAPNVVHDAGIHPDRVRKLTRSTNILPNRLIKTGFSWSTDLRLAIAAWRDASPSGEFV